MRRALILGLLTAVVVAVVLLTRSAASYRVDALFDTADGVTPGMNVEVAGVPVGTVVGVHLTPELKARIQLQLSRRYAPFHADAACQILPEGIISENYVQCSPGSAPAPVLNATDRDAPTVPLAHDSTPVSLQQFVDIFDLPTADRLRVLLGELGIATAGRGSDLNAILRRANPALQQANQVLAQLDAQRRVLGDAIGQTGSVIAQLAGRRQAVREFVDQAAGTARLTAAHRDALSASVAELPGFLGQVGTTAARLEGFSRSATPLLEALHDDVPALTGLTRVVPSFTAAADPALQEIAQLSEIARPALTAARPVLTDLRTFATRAPKAMLLLEQLLDNLRARGGIEYLMTFFYALATAVSSYDGISHTLVLNAIVTQCYVNSFAPGCDRGWGTQASREAAAGHSTTSARAPVSQLGNLLRYLLK